MKQKNISTKRIKYRRRASMGDAPASSSLLQQASAPTFNIETTQTIKSESLSNISI